MSVPPPALDNSCGRQQVAGDQRRSRIRAVFAAVAVRLPLHGVVRGAFVIMTVPDPMLSRRQPALLRHFKPLAASGVIFALMTIDCALAFVALMRLPQAAAAP